MTRSSGNWTLDLWHGEGIQRADGADRTDTLERARQEMRDTGSADLFDAIADEKRAHCVNCACTMPAHNLRPLKSPVDFDLVYGAALGLCPWCGYVCREARS